MTGGLRHTNSNSDPVLNLHHNKDTCSTHINNIIECPPDAVSPSRAQFDSVEAESDSERDTEVQAESACAEGGDGATGNAHNHTVIKEPQMGYNNVGDSEQPRHMSVNADTTISVNNQTQCNILGDGAGHSRFPLQPQHVFYSEVTALPGRQWNAHTRFSDTSPTGGSIPVHISFFNDNNNSQYVDCISRTRRETEDIDDDDFIKYIKKNSKRFYIGGFLPTITREKIERYVNKRGPTVTWVRIWQSRRSPRNVVVRLNVEDN